MEYFIKTQKKCKRWCIALLICSIVFPVGALRHGELTFSGALVMFGLFIVVAVLFFILKLICDWQIRKRKDGK